MSKVVATARIKRAKISFITLCPRGKNGMPTIYKSAADDKAILEADFLVKAPDDFAEKGELLIVVYTPEVPDADGHVADADVIKAMAYGFSEMGGKIDVRHDGVALSKDQAFVAENFIVQKGDARFQGWTDYDNNPVDVTGAWAAVLKINDLALRKSYREGGWNGVSMFGRGELEPITKEDDMALTKEDLEAFGKTLGDSLVKALKPEPIKKEDADDDTPEFDGDPTSLEDVREHAAALKKHKLFKAVKWDNPKSVDAYFTSLEKQAEAAAKAKADAEAPKGSDGKPLTDLQKAQAELEETKKKVETLEKASTQGTGDNKKDDKDGAPADFEGLEFTGYLEKEGVENAHTGSLLAALFNKAS